MPLPLMSSATGRLAVPPCAVVLTIPSAWALRCIRSAPTTAPVGRHSSDDIQSVCRNRAPSRRCVAPPESCQPSPSQPRAALAMLGRCIVPACSLRDWPPPKRTQPRSPTARPRVASTCWLCNSSRCTLAFTWFMPLLGAAASTSARAVLAAASVNAAAVQEVSRCRVMASVRGASVEGRECRGVEEHNDAAAPILPSPVCTTTRSAPPAPFARLALRSCIERIARDLAVHRIEHRARQRGGCLAHRA